jgi:hypothetical protein
MANRRQCPVKSLLRKPLSTLTRLSRTLVAEEAVKEKRNVHDKHATLETENAQLK